MFAKSIMNQITCSVLFASANTMLASKVEDLIKKNKEKFAIEQAVELKVKSEILQNPWAFHFDAKCDVAATRFRGYILGNEDSFTETHLSELIQCINYYQTIYAGIDTKKLDFQQNTQLNNTKMVLFDFQKQVNAYKTAAEADKQTKK
ncbi:MAG TPA: hypothetical protein VGW78_01175 [Candidatus Babeliales bacterium]|jgi:hypothetical protein|nr:hypothetical protein [Candidatus Babeliales bacterium]